mgnify:CR=1 FL=1
MQKAVIHWPSKKEDVDVYITDVDDILKMMDMPFNGNHWTKPYARKYAEYQKGRLENTDETNGYYPSFFGGYGFNMCKRAIKGDFNKAVDIDLAVQNNAEGYRDKLVSSVVGFAPNVGAYLAGRPDCMFRKDKVKVNAPTSIRLILFSPWHSDDEADTLMRSAERIAPTIVALELAGRQVEAMLIEGTKYSRKGKCAYNIECYVFKHFGERLNTGRTAFMCGTPDFIRKCGHTQICWKLDRNGFFNERLGYAVTVSSLKEFVSEAKLPMFRNSYAIDMRQLANADDPKAYIAQCFNEGALFNY